MPLSTLLARTHTTPRSPVTYLSTYLPTYPSTSLRTSLPRDRYVHRRAAPQPRFDLRQIYHRLSTLLYPFPKIVKCVVILDCNWSVHNGIYCLVATCSSAVACVRCCSRVRVLWVVIVAERYISAFAHPFRDWNFMGSVYVYQQVFVLRGRRGGWMRERWVTWSIPP